MSAGRSNTLAWFIANDPILGQGQIGYVTDLAIYKIGDGVTKFSLLPFQSNPIVCNWFAQFKPIQNQSNLLSTAYNNCLIAGTLVQQGDWCNFDYIITVADNSNSKTIFIKFANQTIYSNTPAYHNFIMRLKGEIVCIDYIGKKISYKIEYVDTNGTIAFTYGTLSNIDLSQNNHLLLQLQGVATNDLIAEEGKGVYCAISLPNIIS